MRHRHVGMLGLVALWIGGLLLSAASVQPVAGSVTTQAPVLAAASTTGFTPTNGVIFNDPRFKRSRFRIHDYIVRSINGTARGEFIRIHSWNIASNFVVDHLIEAHRRGVIVRVIMSRAKAREQGDNGMFARLQKALAEPSLRNPTPEKRSWARGCASSCRGRSGIAHTKTYVFSRVRTAEKVVMVSSANATITSAKAQWNDLYTVVGDSVIYNEAVRVFEESGRDRPVPNPYVTKASRKQSIYWYPFQGANATGDRVIKTLNKVQCRGATNGTGVEGRTRIRVAMDAILDARGENIMKKLRSLWQQGCNIKITYAIMGQGSLWVSRRTTRGPIPIRQIVRDWDRDGVYDWYLHSKVLAISGVYAGKRDARVAWNGSENWSQLGRVSDEAGMAVHKPGVERTYASWINDLWANAYQPSASRRSGRAMGPSVDPYAKMRAEIPGIGRRP